MKKYMLFAGILFFSMLAAPAISSAQNVGIGTANPVKGRLEVSGAVGNTSAIFGGDGAGISLQKNNPAIGFNQYYGTEARPIVTGTSLRQYLDLVSGSLIWDTYPLVNAESPSSAPPIRRITIKQNGNISINATDANDGVASLFVGNTGIPITPVVLRGTMYHSVFGERITGQPTQHTYINAGKNGSPVIINDQGLGNVIIGGGTARVGINSPDPQAVLELKQVNGRGLLMVSPPFSFNNWEFAVNHVTTEPQSDLWMYYNAQYKGNFFSLDGLYYQGSDRRLKKNIQPMQTVLQKVMALRPVQYEMKYDNNGHMKSIGFIAQEVKALFPELTGLIKGEEHGYKGIKDLHTMNYDGLGPIAIKAIQEQQEKIKLLKEKNAAFRKRVEEAEKALNLNP